MTDASLRILVVEDNPGHARLLREELRDAGVGQFTVTVAGRLNESLRLIREEPYDAVLLDLSLPDSHGQATVERVQSAAPDLPIIVLTSLDDESTATDLVRKGAQDYLIKGQTDGRLLGRSVRYAVERKQMEIALSRSERQLGTRNRIVNAFLTLSGNEVFGEVMQIVLEALESTSGVFGYLDEEGALVAPSLTRDVWDQCQMETKTIRFPRETWGESIWGRALRGRKPLYSNEPFHVPPGHIPMHRAISAPIIFQENSIGLLNVANRATDYDEQDVALLRAICENIAPVLYARLQRDRQEAHRQRAEEALRQAHDELENRVRARTAELSDANERLRTEIYERRRAERALRDTNELLEKLFAATHVSIAYLDTHFNFIRVNRSYAEHNSRTPDFFVGRNHFELYPHAETQAIFQRVLNTGEPCSFEARPFEYPEYPKRGVAYWDWSLHPVRQIDGRVEGLLLCMVDATKRREAEEQARRHQADLAHVSRLSTLGEMASALAHELNQPLCAIVSWSQACLRMLRSGTGEGTEVLDAMSQVTAQAKRAGGIIHHLREFSRKREPHCGKIDVNRLVRQAAGFVEFEARPERAPIRFELADGLPAVLGDAIQVEQVVVNLVRNGLEAMDETPEDRRQLTIGTSRLDEGMVEVAVRDTGRGLPAGSTDRIFEPFFSGKTDGMGVGLAISRSIIEAHGGRLSAAACPEGGTIFRFSLPIARRD